MLDLSKVWPEWTAEEKLGEGAYGTVYKCVRRERGITSYCAIKVITVPHDNSELDSLKLEGYTDETSREYFNDIVDSFANEIGVMESLKGFPNIVSVEDFRIVEHEDNVGWDIYIRMELLTSFKQYLENHEITQEEVLKLGKDICTALEICEKNGIIHRDIKADNIFVDKSGNFKLGDFGVARQLERTRSTMSRKGTYAYMAPEVAINGKYDKRADVYSLGMVMYKLLNKNRDPFLDTEKQMIRYQERVDAVNRRLGGEDLPKPINADEVLSEIILKACKFNKEDRYSSATEMKAAIASLIADSKEEPEVHEEVQTAVSEKTSETKHENKTTPKTNIKAVGIIVATVAVIVAGVFGIKAIKTKKDLSVIPDEQTTASDSDFVEEEIYRAYLDSEEGRKLYIYDEDKAVDETELYKWKGEKDIYYLDIDNDGIDECLLGLEFGDANNSEYMSVYYVFLLDIKDRNVTVVYTSNELASHRAWERLIVSEFEGHICITEGHMDGNYGKNAKIFMYDGNELKIVLSMMSDIFTYDDYTKRFWVARGTDILGDEKKISGDMLVKESEYEELWNKISESKVITSYGFVDDGMGRITPSSEVSDALYNTFAESEYYYSGADLNCGYKDYNNDGKFEMVVYQYFPQEANPDYEYSGDVFLVTESKVENILSDIYSVNPYNFDDICINGRRFYCFNEGYVSSSATRLFTVINNKIEETSIYNGEFTGCLENIRPYGVAVSFSAYDNFIDGTGHTYKQYYFYWDEESQSFKEYGAIEITQDEFLKCEGAKEILDEAESKGYVINNILYRGNGVININYIVDETELDNINLKLESNGSLTVLHDGYTGIDENNGFGGVYEAAVCPRIAQYPDKFPL